MDRRPWSMVDGRWSMTAEHGRSSMVHGLEYYQADCVNSLQSRYWTGRPFARSTSALGTAIFSCCFLAMKALALSH